MSKISQAKQKYAENQAKEKIYEKKVSVFNPAVKLMNECKSAIENNPRAQDAIINHIRNNGSDDNIYLHGIRYHSGKGVLGFCADYIKPNCEGIESFTSRAIAKDFYRCGRLSEKITQGEFTGYKIVGYSTPLFMRICMPNYSAYYIILRKPFLMKWFGWIRT